MMDADINDTQKKKKKTFDGMKRPFTPTLHHYSIKKRPKTKINIPILSDFPKCMPNHVS